MSFYPLTPSISPFGISQQSSYELKTLERQIAHGFSSGDPIRLNGADWVAADAASEVLNTADAIAVVINANSFYAVRYGDIELSIDEWDAVAGTTGGLTPGDRYYLQELGGLANTTAYEPAYRQKLVIARTSTVALVTVDTPVVSDEPVPGP